MEKKQSNNTVVREEDSETYEEYPEFDGLAVSSTNETNSTANQKSWQNSSLFMKSHNWNDSTDIGINELNQVVPVLKDVAVHSSPNANSAADVNFSHSRNQSLEPIDLNVATIRSMTSTIESNNVSTLQQKTTNASTSDLYMYIRSLPVEEVRALIEPINRGLIHDETQLLLKDDQNRIFAARVSELKDTFANIKEDFPYYATIIDEYYDIISPAKQRRLFEERGRFNQWIHTNFSYCQIMLRILAVIIFCALFGLTVYYGVEYHSCPKNNNNQ